jgi:subtilisin family serine protease
MHHRALHNTLIACILLGWATAALAQGPQPPAHDYVENELIVKTTSDVPLNRLLPGLDEGAAERWPHLALLNQTYRVEGITQLFPQLERSLRDECGARRVHELERELLRVWRVQFPDGFDAAQALDAYRLTPHVEYVELNRLQHVARLPDDPLFRMQWALRNTGQTGGTPGADVHAAAAWDSTTGSRAIVVAVVDTGVDYLHPDLAHNIWRNEGEIPDNGIDDDGNGFVDDVRGWDFVDEDPHLAWPGEDAETPDNDPMDRHGHGTHCSGIIGAVTDNAYGIAGVVWQCRIMPVRAGFRTRVGPGAVPTMASSQAIVYAAANGAHVINMSYGIFWPSPTQYLAVRYAAARGVVLVGAAGNDGVDLIHFPSGFPEVIGVIATDHDDHRLDFSNYGMWCDLAAPGSWIFSTLPGDRFYPMGGTSMAAPHVAGGAAMIRSCEPRFEPRDVRAVLLQSCDNLGEPGFDEQYAFGRMNLERALKFRMTDNITAPSLRWTGEPGFEIDGVEPDEPTTRRLVRFEVTYADPDGDFPRVTQLWLDLDGDGDYAPVERFMMAPLDPDELDFLAGKRYGLALYLPPTTSTALAYRFHFEDARFVADGLPAETARLVVRMAPQPAAEVGRGRPPQ